MDFLLLDDRTVCISSGTDAGSTDLRTLELTEDEVATLTALDEAANGVEVAAWVAAL